MSILKANLKHLCQDWNFRRTGFIISATSWGVISGFLEAIDGTERGVFSTPFLWMFFFSVIITTFPIKVLTKPFSYCLPGHRNIPRQFLFSVGTVLSILWSLSFLAYPDMNIVETIMTFLAAFSSCTIFFWIGAWFVSKSRDSIYVLTLLPLFMLVDKLFNLGSMIQYSVVESSLLMIALGTIVNIMAWRYWSRSDLARWHCAALQAKAFDASIKNVTKARLFEKAKKNHGSTMVSTGVEDLFISRINQSQSGSLQRYVWGSFYKAFGTVISQGYMEWLKLLLISLSILCLLCYIPGAQNIAIIIVGLAGLNVKLEVYSCLLECRGRMQRYYSALALAVVTGALVMVVAITLVIISYLLEPIMPELTINNHQFVFESYDFKVAFVPLLLTPVMLTVHFYRQRGKMMVIGILVSIFQFLIAMSVLGDLIIMDVQVQLSSIHIICVLLFNWILFITFLRYTCMKSSLVTQTKQ